MPVFPVIPSHRFASLTVTDSHSLPLASLPLAVDLSLSLPVGALSFSLPTAAGIFPNAAVLRTTHHSDLSHAIKFEVKGCFFFLPCAGSVFWSGTGALERLVLRGLALLPHAPLEGEDPEPSLSGHVIIRPSSLSRRRPARYARGSPASLAASAPSSRTSTHGRTSNNRATQSRRHSCGRRCGAGACRSLPRFGNRGIAVGSTSRWTLRSSSCTTATPSSGTPWISAPSRPTSPLGDMSIDPAAELMTWRCCCIGLDLNLAP